MSMSIEDLNRAAKAEQKGEEPKATEFTELPPNVKVGEVPDWMKEALASGATEPLHPDLKQCIERDQMFTSVKHPLVFCIPYSEQLNAMVNRSYENKIDAFTRAKLEGNFRKMMWLHERPYRLGFCYTIMDDSDCPDKVFWEILGDALVDTENAHQWLQEINEMIDCDRDFRENLMTEEEQELLYDLPSVIPVYRGCTPKTRTSDYSWTTSRSVAKFFAERTALLSQGEEPIIMHGLVRKEHVIAYFTRRGEYEIFTRNVTDVKTIPTAQWQSAKWLDGGGR